MIAINQSAKHTVRCIRMAVAFAVAICLLLALGCSGSGGSSASRDTAPSTGSAQSNGASHGGSTGAAAAGNSTEEIDSRYVGEWIGYDIYTMEDVNDTYNLHDNGDWATLVVNADGSGSFEGKIRGAELRVADIHLEYGTTEYLVYDSYNELVGSLGYTKSGTTDWLILSIPDDEVGMVCYTFFING